MSRCAYILIRLLERATSSGESHDHALLPVLLLLSGLLLKSLDPRLLLQLELFDGVHAVHEDVVNLVMVACVRLDEATVRPQAGQLLAVADLNLPVAAGQVPLVPDEDDRDLLAVRIEKR